MTSFWTRTGRDNLQNGAILGALLAAAIVWGSTVYEWIEGIVPLDWLVLGEFSLPVYLLGLGALVGYIVDRS